ncbi:hypothetical protein KCU78_g3913, partial [Aureobasidium melanogenum]
MHADVHRYLVKQLTPVPTYIRTSADAYDYTMAIFNHDLDSGHLWKCFGYPSTISEATKNDIVRRVAATLTRNSPSIKQSPTSMPSPRRTGASTSTVGREIKNTRPVRSVHQASGHTHHAMSVSSMSYTQSTRRIDMPVRTGRLSRRDAPTRNQSRSDWAARTFHTLTSFTGDASTSDRAQSYRANRTFDNPTSFTRDASARNRARSDWAAHTFHNPTSFTRDASTRNQSRSDWAAHTFDNPTSFTRDASARNQSRSD